MSAPTIHPMAIRRDIFPRGRRPSCVATIDYHYTSPHIVYEDPHLIVLEKPAGLASQGGRNCPAHLVDWLRGHVKRPYVGLIHRLDRNVSGLMVVAKRTKAARRLTNALREGKICRVYHGLLEGNLERKQTWSHFLKKDPKTNKVRVYRREQPSSQKALLSVTPVQHFSKKWTLAEFQLQTGRSHQIRAQASFEHFPIFGDKKYGGTPFSRLALHSCKLAFPHPMSEEMLSFESPFPEEILKVAMK